MKAVTTLSYLYSFEPDAYIFITAHLSAAHILRSNSYRKLMATVLELDRNPNHHSFQVLYDLLTFPTTLAVASEHSTLLHHVFLLNLNLEFCENKRNV